MTSEQAPEPTTDLIPDVAHAVYLLHFTQAYRHARHYMTHTTPASSGVAGALARLRQGGSEHTPPLVRSLLAAGGDFQLADVWEAEDAGHARRLYQELHRSHPSPGRLCSICHPTNRRGGGALDGSRAVLQGSPAALNDEGAQAKADG